MQVHTKDDPKGTAVFPKIPQSVRLSHQNKMSTDGKGSLVLMGVELGWVIITLQCRVVVPDQQNLSCHIPLLKIGAVHVFQQVREPSRKISNGIFRGNEQVGENRIPPHICFHGAVQIGTSLKLTPPIRAKTQRGVCFGSEALSVSGT